MRRRDSTGDETLPAPTEHLWAGSPTRSHEHVVEDATRRLSDRTAVLPADPGGLVMGRYRLGHRLGAGGFGVVHAAFDERLEREVAVKVLPRADDEGPRAEREAFAAARLSHPGIVAVYEWGEDAHARYLVSELVHGRTLAEVEAGEGVSDRDVARIGIALCDALTHAHAMGVVHRDVKPANVMLPDEPADGASVAKLMDFGVAHLAGAEMLTRTGDVIGTLAYMAPEQAEGQRVTPAADLYALGVVLYEALAGEHPVRAGNAAATARRIGTALPSLARRRRELPRELTLAVDRTVRPRPHERGTLAQLRSALADALEELEDRGRILRGSPVEGLRPLRPPRAPLRAPARVVAGVAAGLAAWAVVAELGPVPPAAPAALAVGAGVLVALLPRAGWIAVAVALVAWIGAPPEGQAGSAVLLAAALLPVPLLLSRDGPWWTAPAAAPLLGLGGLAGAYPALAGQAGRWWARAALGALGAWQLLVAEVLLDRTLYGGVPGAVSTTAGADAGDALRDALGPLLASGALVLAAVWAAFAVVLPVVVRGRRAPIDLALAVAWAGGLVAATSAVFERLGPDVALARPNGLLAGGAAAVALAVAAAAARAADGHRAVPSVA